MSDPLSPAETARSQLLPLMEQLCELAREEQEAEQENFFERIRGDIAHSVDAEDLAGPFMELSTSAFRGFEFSPLAALLLDQVLLIAQTLSTTLSAGSEGEH